VVIVAVVVDEEVVVIAIAIAIAIAIGVVGVILMVSLQPTWEHCKETCHLSSSALRAKLMKQGFAVFSMI